MQIVCPFICVLSDISFCWSVSITILLNDSPFEVSSANEDVKSVHLLVSVILCTPLADKLSAEDRSLNGTYGLSGLWNALFANEEHNDSNLPVLVYELIRPYLLLQKRMYECLRFHEDPSNVWKMFYIQIISFYNKSVTCISHWHHVGVSHFFSGSGWASASDAGLAIYSASTPLHFPKNYAPLLDQWKKLHPFSEKRPHYCISENIRHPLILS